MEFQIKNLQKSINNIMRTVGYHPAYFQKDGEFSIVRKVGRNDYPRFHLYINQNSTDINFRLHLDQKKPSYGDRRSLGEGRLKAHAHSGEYEGDVIETEAERIKNILL